MAEVADVPKSEGKLRWVLGWILLPATIIAALFLSGVHVGARYPDMALSRLLLKVFGAKPGVADPSEPGKTKPREGAKPGEPFRYRDTLTTKQLETIADNKLGLSVDDLECEDVCRAYSKTHDERAIYEVEHCELGRAVSSTPAMLSCTGKFEAVDEPHSEASDKPGDEQPKPSE